MLFLAGLFAGFLLGGLIIAIVAGPGRAPDCDRCFFVTRARDNDREARPAAATDRPSVNAGRRDQCLPVGAIRDAFDPLPRVPNALGASFSVREEDRPGAPPR